MNLKSIEKQEKNMVKLTIEISAEEFDAAIEQVYRKNKSQIAVPGFRKGKAPRKLIEKMYGAELFYEEAINDLSPKALDFAIEKEDIAIAGYPNVSVVSSGPEGLVIAAEVAEKPEITVENYKGVVAPYKPAEVTDQDVEVAMTPYVSRAKSTAVVDRPAQFNDTVNIDFAGYNKDGEAFEGGTGEDYDLVLGSYTFIPGFEEELMGLSAGEEKVFNITFPKKYEKKELAGQEVQFKVKVNAVKSIVVPEIDDEFAKDVSEYDTLEELKAHLREECRQDQEAKAQQEFERAVIDQLIKDTDVEIPDIMIEYERDRLIENNTQYFMNNGVTLEQYLSMTNSNMDQFKETMQEEAVQVIKKELILESIIRQENVEVTEEDIDKYAEKTGQLYGLGASEMKSALPEESLRTGAQMDKAAQIVYDAAVRGPAPEEPEEAEKTEQAE